MKLIILKTKVQSDIEMDIIRKILLSERRIKNWSIDLEDVDNVLRLEVFGMSEAYMISKIRSEGIGCENLN